MKQRHLEKQAPDGTKHDSQDVSGRTSRFSQAEAGLRQLLDIDPDCFEACNDLAVVLRNQHRFAEAEACFRRALAIRPDSPEARNNLGNALREQGRRAEAESCYREAVAIRPDYAEAHSNLGSLLRDLGRLTEAEACQRQALSIKPDYAQAHNNLGVILRDLGRLTEAEACLSRAVAIRPDFGEAYNNLSVVLRDRGQLSEAEACLRRALLLQPEYIEAFSNLGIVLRDQGRLVEAEEVCRRFLLIKPDHVETLTNLGMVLQRQGRAPEAEGYYRQALSIKPDYAEAYNNLGVVLRGQGRLSEAAASLTQALSIKPDFAEAYNNLGSLFMERGRPVEAEACLRRALAVKPEYVEALNSLGVILWSCGRLPEAEACHRRVLSIKPDSAGTYNNLGVDLWDQGRLSEAESCYRQALSIKPDFAGAHSNLGNALREQGRFDEAVASYRRALSIKPDYLDCRSNLLFALGYVPDLPPREYLNEARRYGEVAGKKTTPFSSWLCARRPKRLRVGLVSGDFHSHPVGYILERALAEIDRSRMELIAYPVDPLEDELTARIKPYFSSWKLLGGLNDKEAAGTIHADGVHLLLDCSGHTAKNRLPLFVRRPAPVQATWPGYFASTGLAAMDYILGDPRVTPPGEEGHFTEAVWRLPETYLCFAPPDVSPDVGPLPALSSGVFTFGSFNNLAKINAPLISLWAKILEATPRSRLFLKAKQLNDFTVRDALVERFAACGVSVDRLLLEGYSLRPQMLEAYHRVDVILSPFPYPGGTTSVEGLWMGIPAVVRRGDRFLSHLGESIAHNAGLSEWIADSDEEYVRKAVSCIDDLTRLAELRSSMRARVLASPLFDAPRFARHLETALWGMWERWENDASNPT